MNDANLIEKVRQYVYAHIGTFHESRLNSLRNLELKQLLKRKNPYLFRAKNLLVASDLIRSLLDAHLSSQEETMFGEFLEGLAIYICQETFKGKKSVRPSIDLEFQKGQEYYLVSVKSGPNWGNADQIRKMRENFQDAIIDIKKLNPELQVFAVNGCCYGQDNGDKGGYEKLCGQAFWSFISGGVDELYTQIIEPLGFEAKERNEAFQRAYSAIINTFSQQFVTEFCENGEINWETLIRFNSARLSVKERKQRYS